MQTTVSPDSVALTFDDGPHPHGTLAALDALDALAVPATFFLSGEQVVQHAEVAREIAERGHTVGVHGYRHVVLSIRGPRGTACDLDRALDAIARATGHRPRHFRPPYGVATPAALFAARHRGLQTILWSRWGRDWEQSATPESVAALATRGLRGGDVILLHDADHYSAAGSWRGTVAALPAIVGAAEARGLRCVRLG